MNRDTGCTCPYEQDVLDLVAIDQWPTRADASLQAHVETCDVCSDLALVATAIAADQTAPEPVRVPDATIVWYGARLMARMEGTRRAARPMLIAQALAAVCMVAGAAVTWQMFGAAAMDWVRGFAPESWPTLGDLRLWIADMSPRSRWLVAGLAAWCVLVPLAFYLVLLADHGGETETGRTGV